MSRRTFPKGLTVLCVMLLALLNCCLFSVEVAAADNPADWWVEQQTEQLPTDQVEKYWDQLMKDYGGFFPDGRTPSLMDMLLPGGDGFSLQQ
ncbi:stage III sporulation protein AE, partial [Peribacillus sp. NPDC056705]